MKALRISGRLKATTVGISAAVLVSVLLATGASAAKSPTTVLASSTIVNHRFVKSFSLSNGALVLSPLLGTMPTLSPARETTLLATQGIGGVFEGVGFADVTIERSKVEVFSGPAVSTLDNAPSLVLLTKSDGVTSCPAMKLGEGTSVIPVSSDWDAVVFPLNLKKSDVVFIAASNWCGRLTKNTLAAAFETLSVPWHLQSHATTGTVIVASVPKCGRIIMSGGGGNERTGQFYYQVEAAVLDRSVGTTCSPATNVDDGPDFASTSTTHGFTGPVLSAGPHAGDVMTSKGSKAQPLF